MARKRILLVDDAETILFMEKLILNKTYDVITAKNGEEAVSLAIAERPDLILLDVMMPIKGGYEACKELRSKAETRDIPIIMVTTRGEAKSVETGFESGCTDYVTKPINSGELLTKVRTHIGD